MSYSFRIFFPLCAAAAAFSVSAQEAQRPEPCTTAAPFSAPSQGTELTARELFYDSSATPAAATPANTPRKPPKNVAKKPTAPATQQAANKSPSSQAAAAGATTYSGQVIPVSDGTRATAPHPASGTALGLKYTILKLSGNARTPVAPSSVFHAGDHIRFSIETNSPGYLYIVSQGSSGTWQPMFPSPEMAGGSDRVELCHTYLFPPEAPLAADQQAFGFDQQAGDEKLFIIFSRDPKPDFEQLVYSLQGGKTQPMSEPGPKPQSQQMLRASIDDAAVTRLHEMYSRDLVIERVGDDPHADAQEKAVYVVNATGSPDSAVVATLHLVHQ